MSAQTNSASVAGSSRTLGVERIALKLAAAMELNGTAEPGSRHCESVLSLAFFAGRSMGSLALPGLDNGERSRDNELR